MTAIAEPPDGYRCFLAEWYLSPAARGGAGEIATRLRDGAQAMSTGAEKVRFLNLIAVPVDDTCFGLFAGDSADLVKAVFEATGIEYERIVGAVQIAAGD